jgi:hypothetical protein
VSRCKCGVRVENHGVVDRGEPGKRVAVMLRVRRAPESVAMDPWRRSRRGREMPPVID